MPAATSKRSSLTLAVACLGALALAACATTSPPPRSTAQQAKTKAKRVASPQSGGRYMVGSPYQVGGVWYVPSEQPNYDKEFLGLVKRSLRRDGVRIAWRDRYYYSAFCDI